MSTNQPRWRCVANLGDVNPVDYGGYFVYVDDTGVYAPEAELLEPPADDDDTGTWTVSRFILEPCTYVDGVLSDNPHHPTLPAWFASAGGTGIPRLASFAGMSELALLALFCSADAVERAQAWRVVVDYYGVHELDQYPRTMKCREAERLVKERKIPA